MKKYIVLIVLLIWNTTVFAVNPIKLPITNNPLPQNPDTLRVLLIGNSFTYDLTRYIGDVLRASEIDINTCCIYILWESGASITHWDKWYIEKNTFKLSRMGGNLDSKTTEGTVQEILAQHWDVIGLQQTSDYSTNIDSYSPYLCDMIGYIKQNCTNPNVSICWQLTWSYWDGVDKEGPKEELGWEEIVATTDKMISQYGIDIIIPSGTAIENARKTRLNTPHSLTRDGHHVSYGTGQYVLACTLFESVFKPIYNVSILGNKVRYTIPEDYKKDSKYECADISDETAYVCQQCAIAAVANWHSITMVDSFALPPASFYVFPNPVTNTITIRNTSFVENFPRSIKFQLYDSFGNILLFKQDFILRDYELDVSHLKSGQYYLVTNDEDNSKTLPFIKL